MYNNVLTITIQCVLNCNNIVQYWSVMSHQYNIFLSVVDPGFAKETFDSQLHQS